jgi:hypothetical protein
MPEDIGNLWKTQIPDLSDDADITEALRLYHYGSLEYDVTKTIEDDLEPFSIAKYFQILREDVDDITSYPFSYSSTEPTTGLVDGYVWVNSSDNVIKIYASGSFRTISSAISLSATYSWTGAHTFGALATFNQKINAKKGINVFTTPTERTTALGASPEPGTQAFLVQDGSSNTINQVQVFVDGAWKNVKDVEPSSKTADYTMTIVDSGKTLYMGGGTAGNNDVTIPLNATVPFAIGARIEVVQTGTAQTSFVPVSGVTLNSKFSNRKISARYGGATLIKTATDTWLLIGDLTA